MKNSVAERRLKQRRKPNAPRVVRLELSAPSGNTSYITADLIDVSAGGVGIAVLRPLAVGSRLVVRGNLGPERAESASPAVVRWCTERPKGGFHAGLEFDQARPAGTGEADPLPVVNGDEEDHYETMQLSPNADTETIQRVYRLLAQRYHPDSLQTGDPDMFRRLSEAYRVLSNPALRAKFDAHHSERRRLQWSIFDQAKAPLGPEAERRKRQGILELLYAKTLNDPERATMTIFDFEQLLCCPREHLEAALWYLRGKGLVKRSDNGRVAITVEGFDEVERSQTSGKIRGNHLLGPGADG